MDKNIALPKNYKKLKWRIFRNIQISTFLFLLTCLFLGALFFITNLYILIKVMFASIFWLIGCLGIIKINNKNFWIYIFNILFYLFSNKKYIKEKIKIYSSPNNEFVFEKSGRFFSAWEIRNFSTDINNSLQVNNKIAKLESFLKIVSSNYEISLLKINENININKPIKNILDLISNSNNKIKNNFLDVELQVLEDISNDKEFKYNKIILIIYISQSKININSKYKIIDNQVSSYFASKKINLKKIQQIDEYLWSSSEAQIKHNFVIQNKNKYKFIGIDKYPQKVPQEWIKELLLLSDEAIINLHPINFYDGIKQLENAIQKINFSHNINKSIESLEDSKQYRNSLHKTLLDIYREKDLLKEINIIFKLNVTTTLMREQKTKIFKELQLLHHYKFNHLLFSQKNAVRTYGLGNFDHIKKELGMPLTSHQIATGSMLPSSFLNDDTGMYIGYTINEKLPIIFDPFIRSKVRRNSNIIIFGTSGSGKSVLLKKIMKHQIIKNNRLFVIDIEKEYEKIVKKFNGEYITFGQKNSQINPLQIFDVGEHNAFNKQLIFIKSLFKTLFKADEYYITQLTSIVKQTYEKFKINNLTNFRKKINWPIFTNVFFEAKNFFVANSDISKQNKAIMLSYLMELHDGVYSSFLNQKTNISFSKKITCFNLNHLSTNSTQAVNNIVMFMILKIMESSIIKNREEKIKTSIIVDEAWKMIDRKNPIALQFLYEQAKRIRKYNGSLILATQNIRDLSGSSEILKYTEGIINNMQYKFYGGLKQGDLKSLIDISKSINNSLSQSTINFLNSAQQGQFFFQVESNFLFNIQVLYYNHEKLLFENSN